MMDLKCAVHFIDYEGRCATPSQRAPLRCFAPWVHGAVQHAPCIRFPRSDSRSIPKLVANLKPRRVVLVRGSARGKESLGSSMRRAMKDESLPVATPLKGQCVSLTEGESSVFRVSLKDSLVQNLTFATVGPRPRRRSHTSSASRRHDTRVCRRGCGVDRWAITKWRTWRGRSASTTRPTLCRCCGPARPRCRRATPPCCSATSSLST